MRFSSWCQIALSVSCCLALSRPAGADPCGMVPPISIEKAAKKLERIGIQKTYVFYRDRMETWVIRPGFSGNVAEFGMLIPFPNPPVIRKVSDDIFNQIEAAIDPPEVTIDLSRPFGFGGGGFGGGFGGGGFGGGLGYELPVDQVQVIREEAVGMYEVAVLRAGSAWVLKQWMDEHGYRFPKGMERPCQDYVNEKWSFVAVRTNIGTRKGIEPRAGMKSVRSKLPPEANFDGYVQAMGFRFASDKLVVPMRLSAFNGGELRNIIYLLTDGPKAVVSLPKRFVVRQIPGQQLYNNFRSLLPVRVFGAKVVGGRVVNLNHTLLASLRSSRDPDQHMFRARELFATDLLASRKRTLSHPHERLEKELLRISEQLNIRGREIDEIIEGALVRARDRRLNRSIRLLKKMTLTVIDGDFPRDILAEENLTFHDYSMPKKRNRAKFYNCRKQGPGRTPEKGVLIGRITEPSNRTAPAAPVWTDPATLPGQVCLVLASVVLLGGVGFWRLPRRWKWMPFIPVVLAGGAVVSQSSAQSDSVRAQVDALANPERARGSAAWLIANGQRAVRSLTISAQKDYSVTRQGWAIYCLSQIRGADVIATLEAIASDEQQSPLARTWARAGLFGASRSLNETLRLATRYYHPALKKTVRDRLLEQMIAKKQLSPERLIEITVVVPDSKKYLDELILQSSASSLSGVMVGAAKDTVRRQATGFLATVGQSRYDAVANAVLQKTAFKPKAQQVPWGEGALFIPHIEWQPSEAERLVRSLISWHLWCDRNGRHRAKLQIDNNLRSVRLAHKVGYVVPSPKPPTLIWLRNWTQVSGKDQLRELLSEQGAEDELPYTELLNQ